ncbi:hypothetical protein [Reinekea marinisedimentorum]|uniref:Uncharacterized protein n=1 Tax=Reinekea marinisedimentorum TaxID=230495 RepID=A0A4R3HS26_9GAMM|nr:hypothetical protein [Reinekea marinisedimentorum]TCS35937.1 hypothetical protein BCF53_12827 [Reinekea marinisedimentorum]
MGNSDIKRQALVLLAIANKPVCNSKNSSLIHEWLHEILAGTPPKFNVQIPVLFEIAAQITGNFESFASLYLKTIQPSTSKRYKLLEAFAKRGGPFWFAIWEQLNKHPKFEKELISLDWAAPQKPVNASGSKQSLQRVIGSADNGFEYEHALIKLGLSLAKLLEKTPAAYEKSPREISITISSEDSWSELWQQSNEIVALSLIEKEFSVDPRFKVPDWIVDSNSDSHLGDEAKLYWVGTVLRAAALGGTDYTGNRWKQSKTTAYKGVRSNWYKRRMGMMHSPENLVGEYSTVSSWFSDLLCRCLQWPGFESTYVKSQDILTIDGLSSFKRILKLRLTQLNTLVCSASNLPAIPSVVDRKRSPTPEIDRLFRLVTVQQLMPYQDDFSMAGIKLDDPKYKARHTEHLSTVCKIVTKTLEAKRASETVESGEKSYADLIVFPELSVHLDDERIIKRLVDQTKAIVFAGLVFKDHQGKLVNVARWFIPDYRDTGRQWVIRDQGEENLTNIEKSLGITSYRPCQHLIVIDGFKDGPFTLTGSICYDATDIKLAADLRDKTDLYVIAAHNQDVSTFDNMAAALQYHMYQHVVIANIGQFGGSTIQAPYKIPYERLISHTHGSDQISINIADVDLAAFRREVKKYREVKTKPAGMK